MLGLQFLLNVRNVPLEAASEVGCLLSDNVCYDWPLPGFRIQDSGLRPSKK